MPKRFASAFCVLGVADYQGKGKGIMSPEKPRKNPMINSLRTAFKKSGWVNDELEESFRTFAEKIEFLNSTGRFASLIRDLMSCNDGNNLRSLILEASFAYQFEVAKKSITYEQCEIEDSLTSVDFVRSLENGERGCFELRLIQQQQRITDEIEKQLGEDGSYTIFQDADDNVREILRLQKILVSKCITDDGKITKFEMSCDKNTCNVIVVDITNIVLNAVDKYDCWLSLYGMHSVPVQYQLKVNGLFENRSEMAIKMPDDQKDIFENFSNIIHAVMFLKRDPSNDPFNYNLKKLLIQNNSLVEKDQFLELACELEQVFDNW